MFLRVSRFLIWPEGGYPPFFWQTLLPRQHIRPASASQAVCEEGSRHRPAARPRPWFGVGKQLERVSVQALVAQPSFDGRHESYVGRLARRLKASVTPFSYAQRTRFRDELRPIVHADGPGCAADRRDLRHRCDHLLPLDALVDVDRQRFASEGIDDSQRS